MTYKFITMAVTVYEDSGTGSLMIESNSVIRLRYYW